MKFKISYAGQTDPGLVRKNNEDAWGAVEKEYFFALADGMGGHRAGDVAAHEAIDAVCSIMRSEHHEKDRIADLRHHLYQTIREVNAIVYSISVSNSSLRGMGTTLCCLQVHPEGVVYGHVGDSRIYRLRDHRLLLLTKDHSLMHELIDLGQLEHEESVQFGHRNVITKAIGSDLEVEPTVDVIDFKKGDLFLLCSDGLTDMLPEGEILLHLNQKAPLSEIAENLVEAANHAGGHDNITVVLVKIA